MTIAFNDIPSNLLAPGFFVEFDSSRAVSGTPARPHVVLLIGHSTTATTKLAFNTPTRIFSTEDGNDRAGRGSALALMIERYRNVDSATELWAAALPDVGGGGKAAGTFTFGGTATETGTAVLYIGDFRVPVPVTSGDTAATVATAALAEINKDPTRYPATGGVATVVLTLTSRTDTTADNDLVLSNSLKDAERLPAGLTLATVNLAGGTGAPDVTAVVTNMADQQFHTVVTQFTDDTNMDVLETLMLDRWGPQLSIEGHLFAGICDTVGTSTTAGNLRNSQVTSLVAFQETPTSHWAAAAQAAARDAVQTQLDPARPRQTLSLPGVFPPARTAQWTYRERDIALTDGLATVTYDAATGTARINFLATTYQTSASGAPDPSFLSITTPRTIGFLRYSLQTRFALKFPQHKLASDAARVAPGQKIITPRRATAELIVLFREWEAAGLVEDIDQYKSEIRAEIDATNKSRLNVLIGPNLINQFRIMAVQMQFIV